MTLFKAIDDYRKPIDRVDTCDLLGLTADVTSALGTSLGSSSSSVWVGAVARDVANGAAIMASFVHF